VAPRAQGDPRDGVDDPPYDPDAPFTTEHSSAAVIEQYRRQCVMSNEILQSRDLHSALLGEHGLDWPHGPITDLRWVVLHMIEGTARHAGHRGSGESTHVAKARIAAIRGAQPLR
jgi:hypothetical protein